MTDPFPPSSSFPNQSSASSGKFAGLMNQKRNSDDLSAATRKAAFAEQKPAPGFIGSMWNSFTKGHPTGK